MNTHLENNMNFNTLISKNTRIMQYYTVKMKKINVIRIPSLHDDCMIKCQNTIVVMSAKHYCTTDVTSHQFPCNDFLVESVTNSIVFCSLSIWRSHPWLLFSGINAQSQSLHIWNFSTAFCKHNRTTQP